MIKSIGSSFIKLFFNHLFYFYLSQKQRLTRSDIKDCYTSFYRIESRCLISFFIVALSKFQQGNTLIQSSFFLQRQKILLHYLSFMFPLHVYISKSLFEISQKFQLIMKRLAFRFQCQLHIESYKEGSIWLSRKPHSDIMHLPYYPL